MTKTTLTADQESLREDAAQYADKYLAHGRASRIHSKHLWPIHTHQRGRFESTRGLYRTAVQYGLLKAHIPQVLGGSQTSSVDPAVIFEETYAIDSSVTLTLAATGLGLLPLTLSGTADQQKKFLQPFLAGKGEPLASLMHSEPGGTAGWLGEQGLRTTARRDGPFWIVNGEKEGNLNSAGWDRKGADIQCLVCRVVGPAFTDVSASRRESIIVLLVTRELIAQQGKESWQVLHEPEIAAHPAISGPRIRITNLRVPDGIHVLSIYPDKGAELIERCFAYNAAMSAACAVSVMKHALERSRRFARLESRGLSGKIATFRGVGVTLTNLEQGLSEARRRAWQASRGLDAAWSNVSEEMAYTAMLVNQQKAMEAVTSAMQVVGPFALRGVQEYTQWLVSAACLPLIDNGVWTLENGHASRLDDSLANGVKGLRF